MLYYFYLLLLFTKMSFSVNKITKLLFHLLLMPSFDNNEILPQHLSYNPLLKIPYWLSLHCQALSPHA